MFDPATRAVEAALAAGATYADARVVIRRHERLSAQNGELQSVRNSLDAGLGVRALVGSSWGFAASSDLGDEAAAGRTGAEATATAKASALVPGRGIQLADVTVAEDSYETPHLEDPFSVPLDEKVGVIVGATQTMAGVEGIRVASAQLMFWDTDKWFVSSQGHRIHQHLVESGCGMDATALGEHETQRRSYPQSFGHVETGGYEMVRRFDLPGNAQHVAEEAVQLLSAEPCPSGELDLILESSQLALQIHESVGHAIELDRILGWEAAFAGTSFLELDQLGSLRYGSELMNITADATIPRGLSTFGYDDEGTPAQAVDIVRGGTWVGVLSGRDSAHLAGLPPGGMVRGDGFNRMPMVRMTNVGLEPGDSSLEEIVSETKHGVVMATNRSWSIDDRRLNFQFGCEIGWEVRDGKRVRMVRNPTYTGITPRFWASLDMLAGEGEWHPWGVPNCGKGQPTQVGHTGHPASPGRFRNVRIGVTT
ncbi:TldD/PmbA family protein [Egibacter rhizosphaerae]|uniref:TldD/PmbA family protein n=1 Tax=Egibacter rhizosphaerae TaxID=1670831 RepID=A0A411YC55_9ACTN|nr:TldD/PmbA family protein [Egibacter rhizosphaerae]QBI18768.1 TldD/PmbA family protein [Egibacter rhizosphaerae]